MNGAEEFDTRENEIDREEADLFEDGENKDGQEQIINELVEEFTENRKALKGLITDLEELKANIDKIFPQNLDARYMRFFEDKVKAATQLFSAILNIRQEIAKGIKTEIELRRNNDPESGGSDMISHEDLRAIANKLDGFKKVKPKIIKKIKKVEEND